MLLVRDHGLSNHCPKHISLNLQGPADSPRPPSSLPISEELTAPPMSELSRNPLALDKMPSEMCIIGVGVCLQNSPLQGKETGIEFCVIFGGCDFSPGLDS